MKGSKPCHCVPINIDSCFSTTVLLAKDDLSFDLALVTDRVHFLSDLSSSDVEPVQSRVAPWLDDDGTGCRDIVPVDGLKSISVLVLGSVRCDGFVPGVLGWSSCVEEGNEESGGVVVLDSISFGGELEVRPCKRASRRAFNFKACCTSLRILGSVGSERSRDESNWCCFWLAFMRCRICFAVRKFQQKRICASHRSYSSEKTSVVES